MLIRSSLRLLAAGCDDRLEYVDHLLRIGSDRLSDVEGLLDGHAETAGDGEHGDGRAEVDVEFGVPVVHEARR